MSLSLQGSRSQVLDALSKYNFAKNMFRIQKILVLDLMVLKDNIREKHNFFY